jgi:Mg2+-importing ATPase
MLSSNKPLEHYASAGIKEVFNELKSSPNGISFYEAEKRIEEFGHNHIVEKKNLGVFIEFISHFKNPLVIILIIAAIVSFYFGESINAAIIGVMVLLSVFLDFSLEHNAKNTAEKLREHVKTKATVLRNGEKKEIRIEDLCVGDIILLSAGNMIPADARIMESKDFFVNQASLTGESFPVEKTASAIKSDHLSIVDLTNIVFLGTSVISGSATAIIVKTGKETEFGKIASKLVSGNVETEFDKGINKFGYLIMKVTIFLVLFIFLFNSLLKHNVLESFLFSIAVAVGLTPELLPMIISVTMAQGSLKMAKKGVIVKKLSSISNFGSMDILCTDKTGTLTEDKIKLVKYTDVFGKDFSKVFHYAYLNSFHHTGIKNPLDEAVLEFKDINMDMDIKAYKKIDEIPFDFARRRMSIVAEKAGKRIIITKGAPEEIFRNSKYYYSAGKKMLLNDDVLEKIKKQYHKFSMEGYRVLAVAIKQVPKNKTVYDKKDESDLEIIGFVSFLDPAKQDVKEVLLELEKSGIEIKILTGDNELVTKKICDDINLNVKGVLLGNEIDSFSDEALKAKVNDVTIFARFSPDQKNRVIRALKANGHVVGYLGDGINDAPALKNADIGISVNSAVDVAKETADIILTHKSLRVLREGVLDGRMTFGNTIKYIMMGLSSNFGNMFSLAAAVIFLPFLPMLPVQILLNNFIYDFSQITIPTDNVDKEFMQKPKRWNMKFIKEFMFVFGPISSVFDILTFILLFVVFKVPAAMFQTGWFIESLATQALVIHVIRTKRIPFLQSTASPQLLFSSVICVAIGWIIPYTRVGRFFGFSPLPAYILFSIAGLVIVYLFIVEIAKRLFYRRYDF